MKYHIERILHQLYFYRKRYLVIWAELFAGIIILSICSNKLLTSRAAMRELEQSLRGKDIMVQYNYLGELFTEPCIPIGYEQYQAVKEEFAQELELSYLSIVYLNVFWGENWDRAAGCNLIFMDDVSFAELFDEERQPDTAYAGEKARQVLEQIRRCKREGEQISLAPKLDLEVKDEELLLLEDVCKVASVPATQAKEILTRYSDLYSTEESKIYLEDCLILPVEWMEKLESMQEEWIDFQVVLKAEAKDKENELAVMNRLTKRLGELNPRFAFKISPQYLSLKAQKEDMDWTGQYWLRISIVVLLLVGGSMTGILLVQLYQRRRMKAVAYVCGSTKLQLEIETLAEFLILFTAAVTPGGFVGWRLNVTGKTGLSWLSYFPESNLILIGAAALILAAVYLVAGVWERRLTFIQVLKGE